MKYVPRQFALICTFLVALLCIVFLIYPLFAHAADAKAKYEPLVGIPGLNINETYTLPQYLNQIYLLLIAIGAIIGVIKITFAGMKYSLSDIVTSKEEAKEDIKGVLLGLVLLLIPFVVLNTIYPDLTNLDVLKPIESGGSTSNIETTNALTETWEPVAGKKKIICNNSRTDCSKLCEGLNGVSARPADPNVSDMWTCTFTPR